MVEEEQEQTVKVIEATNGQLKLVRTISIIVTLCVLFVSWGITLGVLYSNVGSNAEDCKENKSELEVVKLTVSDNREKMLLLSKDITQIRETVTEINFKLSGIAKIKDTIGKSYRSK